MSAEIDALKIKLESLKRRTVQNCEGLRAEMSDAQARADGAYRGAGYADGAPQPLMGESLHAYRRRLIEPFKSSDPNWKRANIANADEALLSIAEKQILDRAVAAQSDPQNFKPGELRTVVSLDSTGRKITKFYGDPSVAWRPFQHAAMKFVRGFGRAK